MMELYLFFSAILTTGKKNSNQILRSFPPDLPKYDRNEEH